MSRLQAVVLVVGTGIAWIGYSLGFQALGIPQMIEAGAPGRTSQAQVQTSDQTITRYQVLATPTATPRATNTATATPRPTFTATPVPTPEPRTPVREVWEKHGDGLFYRYAEWSDGTRELVPPVVTGKVNVHSSQGPYGVIVHVSKGYTLYGCLEYGGGVSIYPPSDKGVPVATSALTPGCVSYEAAEPGYYTIRFTTDTRLHPGYFWFDIEAAKP